MGKRGANIGAMTAHERSTPSSQHFCDVVLARLRQGLHGVTRNEAGNVCSVGVDTKFAYIYHRRGGLRIYLRGEDSDGQQLEALCRQDGSFRVTKRSAMGSPWAQVTPYFVDIENERAAGDAVSLLLYAAAGVSRRGRSARYSFPSELSAKEMIEGARLTVQVSRVERDQTARMRCIQMFGTVCQVCGFDFAATYGEIGAGFIHIHHLNPLAASRRPRKVNPQTDLRPVCPNCHEMLHRRDPPFTIEELKTTISGAHS